MASQKTLTIALCASMSPKPAEFNISCVNDIIDVFFHYFSQVLGHSSAPKDANKENIFAAAPIITWDAKASDITDTDLVVYFRQDNASSIILDTLGKTPTPAVAALKAKGTLGGLTDKTSKGVVSEVFVDGGFPTIRLAHSAMHELMHNKLEQVNRAVGDLHTQGGGGLAIQGADEYSIFTKRNVELMALNLNKPVKQNTDYLQPLGTLGSGKPSSNMPVANDSSGGYGMSSKPVGDLSKEKSALDAAIANWK